MILKASQRGGGKQLAHHLLNTRDNDHVRVHDVRGFVSSDLVAAFNEAHAVSRGTKCKQFLFSLSLNPPDTEAVAVDVFEKAIDAIEAKMGLTGQPRAIVFHEKQGRRHAHCVWSRIDAGAMKAINLPHFKLKLRDMSRQFYMERGWKMPRGLMDSEARDPLNYTLAEWQQAKRAEVDPRALKTMFKECWAVSDSAAAFRHALQERGFYLARGDRRAHVAVDWRGEVYSLSRWAAVKPKEIRARLGEPDGYAAVEKVKRDLAGKLADKLQGFRTDEDERLHAGLKALEQARRMLVMGQRQARAALRVMQSDRAAAERKARAAMLPTGLRALWSRITGKYAAIKKEIETQAQACDRRDRQEFQQLADGQLAERRTLREQEKRLRAGHEEQTQDLDRDLEQFRRQAVWEAVGPPTNHPDDRRRHRQRRR
jgi:hypothetical protein